MKMYREELRQVSILLNLTIIIGLYYILGVLFVGFTQFKFKWPLFESFTTPWGLLPFLMVF